MDNGGFCLRLACVLYVSANLCFVLLLPACPLITVLAFYQYIQLVLVVCACASTCTCPRTHCSDLPIARLVLAASVPYLSFLVLFFVHRRRLCNEVQAHEVCTVYSASSHHHPPWFLLHPVKNNYVTSRIHALLITQCIQDSACDARTDLLCSLQCAHYSSV